MIGLSQHTRDIERLKATIGRLERNTNPSLSAQAAPETLCLGVDAIDRHLPAGGLPAAALHEIADHGRTSSYAAAAAALVGSLLGRLGSGPVLWAQSRPDLFPAGLLRSGFDPARLILVHAGPGSILAIMEEALRHRVLNAVVGEVEAGLDLTASRRLQLAAEAAGIPAFTLRRSVAQRVMTGQAPPIAAATRWRISPEPGPALRTPQDARQLPPARWRLELIRCRGGNPATWILEEDNEPGRFHLASHLADRPAAPPTAPVWANVRPLSRAWPDPTLPPRRYLA